MIVDLFSVRADGALQYIDRARLTDCFPDDPDSAAQALSDLKRGRDHYAGGGAAPVFVLKAVPCQHR